MKDILHSENTNNKIYIQLINANNERHFFYKKIERMIECLIIRELNVSKMNSPSEKRLKHYFTHGTTTKQ